MTDPQQGRKVTAVLDSESCTGRSLQETVQASGHDCVVATTVEELVASLRDGTAIVGLVAFEALWPTPQRVLRQLRELAPATRLVVAYREDSPRLVLGQRLWSVNLIDYWIQRSTPPHEMGPLLRQAHSDALIERSARSSEHDPAQPGSGSMIFSLQHLAQSLNNARTLDELLRVLHRKLYRLLDYQLLQVLICSSHPYRLFTFPVAKIPHERFWHLAESACGAVAPHLDADLTPEQLVVHDAAPLTDEPEEAAPGAAVNLPMLLHGQIEGCISLLPHTARPFDDLQLTILRLVATHLASGIRNVETLQATKSSATVDELTGLPNQRFLESALPREWSRVARYNLQLTVVILDIDQFSEINSREGHVVGDAVLKGAARLLGQYVRETDHLVYLGDDRFMLMLTETGPAEAAVVVERMRLAFKKVPVSSSGRHGPIQITCSAGVASFPGCSISSAEDLVQLAFRAVRSAKDAGRDQMIVASGQAFESVFPAPPSQDDKRRYPRIPSDLAVRYIELPDFEGHLAKSRSLNVNARGIAIEDPQKQLHRHSYALVYIEDAQTPLLSRVVWTKDSKAGKRSAGLQFLQAKDIDQRVRSTQEIKVLPKALVITEDARTWVQVQRVLIAARYQIKVLKRGMAIPAPDELTEYALVVVGERSLREWLGPSIEVIRQRLRSPARVVVINETESRAEALETIASQRIDHFVASNETSDAALFATLNKLLVGEYFGMHKYLLWGVTPKSWTIHNIEAKGGVLDGVRQVAQEVYCHPRITDLLIAAVDEMVVNAMYHSQEIDGRESPSQVTVECGTDGRLLAVSVVDEEGSFLADDLYRGLSQGLARGKEGVPDDASSAGLGFRIMLDCLSQLAINVEPGRRTEVIGIVDLRKPFREYRRSVPTLGLFDKQDRQGGQD